MPITKLADGAEVELRLNDRPFYDGLQRAQDKLRQWGTTFATVGAKVTAAGAAITVPILAAVKSATDLGNELYRTSKRTGLSVETLSGLKNAADVAGVSLDELVGKLQETGMSAQQIATFAKDFGPFMSTADAQAAASLHNAMAGLVVAMKQGAVVIGSAIVPELIAVKDSLAEVVAATGRWLNTHRELIRSLFKIGGYLGGVGAGIVGLGVAFNVAGKAAAYLGPAISVIGTVLGVLLSPLGLTVAALAGLGYYLVANTKAGAQAANVLSRAFGIIKDDGLAAFNGIRDALSAGDIGLAVKILMATLRLEFARGLGVLKEKWLGFRDVLKDGWNTAVDYIAKKLIGMKALFQLTCIEVGAFFRETFEGITDWLAGMLLKIDGWLGGHVFGADALKNHEAEAERAAAAREAEREKARGAIVGDEQAAKNEIDAEAARRAAQPAPNHDPEIAAIRAEIARLEAERDALVGKAKGAAAGVAGRRNAIDARIDDLQGLLNSGAKNSNATIEATFNPFAAGGFGGGQSPVAKLVNVAQQQLDEAKALVREMRNANRRKAPVWAGA